MDTAKAPLTLLRRDEVKRRTGLSTSGLYQLMQQGDLPRPVKLTGGTVAWPEHEIEDFIAKRIARRNETWRQVGAPATHVVEKLQTKL
jgi:prophage regulatory protein